MPNYTDRDAGEAQRIIQGIFDRELSNRDTNENIPLADIEEDTLSFIEDLEILNEIGANVPAMPLGGENVELVPMALRYYLEANNLSGLPLQHPLARRHYFRDFWYDWPYYVRDSINENETSLSHEQARTTFQRRAADFLATRIARLNGLAEEMNGPARPAFLSVFRRKGGSKISTPGCTFSVSSNSPGLRVFWSGGYCISPKFFGSPTSPASSTLQSGTYVFGVDGGAYGSTIQWDTSALVTLPGNPSVHLNY